MSNEGTDNQDKKTGPSGIPGAQNDKKAPESETAAPETAEDEVRPQQGEAPQKPGGQVPGAHNPAAKNRSGIRPDTGSPLGIALLTIFNRRTLGLGLRAAKWGLAAALVLPPVYSVTKDGVSSAAVNRTIGIYGHEMSVAKKGLSVVFAPLGWAGDIATGNGGGVKADYVLYCKPNLRVQAMNQNDQRRLERDDAYMQGRVDSWLTEPKSRVWNMLNDGKYPVIISRYSDPATGTNRHIWVDAQDSQQEQICPAQHQPIPISIRNLNP
jgi:hypothetical protein